jgi:hypothetical protein
VRQLSVLFGTLPVSLGILAAIVVVLEAPVEVRAPIVLAFLAGGPGAAIVGLLGLDDPLHQLTLSVAMSIAVSSLVSLVSLYAGLWSPTGILLAIVMITIATVSLQRLLVGETNG